MLKWIGSLCLSSLFLLPAQQLGPFDASGDVGETPRKGAVEYAAAAGEFRVTGGGANMWAQADAFHFLWKKMSGDVAVTADVRFIGPGAVAHRKAALVIRQSLEPGSAYADIAVHGDGLTSLQYRSSADAVTEESRSSVSAPTRIRIERRGNQFTIFAGPAGGELKTTGPVSVALQDPVYVGLGVCSHDANILETAVFSNVRVEALRPPQRYGSTVAIYDLRKKSVTKVYETDELMEAPNWSRDGKWLLVNSGGRLYRLGVDQPGAKPERVNLDASLRCNNDHDLSPDGRQIGFSASSPTSRASQVYVAAADGSNPKLLTPQSPSYFHGWSPDGAWLAFVAQREGHFNLFRVGVGGGAEQRLTAKPAYDDGPDYSPDGRWIYFNSNRSGGWDIWRIPAAGGGADDQLAERVTGDDGEDWFPHPSPNGKWMVFLTFPKGTEGHNGRMEVALRLQKLPGAKLKAAPIQKLHDFFGGQGSINVNSWAPDSRRFAFVVYRLLQ